jgi:hypothetical protein
MAEKLRHRQESAEGLAIAALAFLAGRPEELARFLALSGIEPGRIRSAAAAPGFLAAVLEHISSDESLLLAFAADGNLSPAAIGEARRSLAGDQE